MKKNFQFFSCNSRNKKDKMIYAGWCTEQEMITLSQGLVIGLREHHKRAFVTVYEVIDGISHLTRVQE